MSVCVRWRAYPAVRLTLGFILGLLVSGHLSVRPSFLLISYASIAIIVLYSSRLRTQLEVRITGIGTWGLILLTGVIYGDHIVNLEQLRNHNDRIVSGFIVVEEIPPTATSKCRIIGRYYLFEEAQNDKKSRSKNLIFYSDSLCSLFPGDTLIFKGKLHSLKLRGFHGEGFNSYLINKRIYNQLYPAYLVVRKASKIDFTTRWAYVNRKFLVDKIKKYLPGKEGDFLVSLCLGYRIVDRETKYDFQAAGAMHILAISGLHIGLAGSLIGWGLGRLFSNDNISRIQKSVLTQISVWGFVLLSGNSEPAVRAAIMLSVWDWGRMWDRKAHWSQLLSISALIQILWEPNNLFKPGFQLSYLAVSSILLTIKWIQVSIRLSPWWAKWLTGMTLVSLAAQLGVAGISILHFNQFPILFLLSNLVAMPGATIFLIGGWGFLLCISIFPGPISEILAKVIGQLISLFLRAINFISENTPDFFLQIHAESVTILIYYIMASLLIGWLYWRKNWLILFAFFSCSTFILSLKSDYYRSFRNAAFTIWRDGQNLSLADQRNRTLVTYNFGKARIPFQAEREIKYHGVAPPGYNSNSSVLYSHKVEGSILFLNNDSLTPASYTENCTLILANKRSLLNKDLDVCCFNKIICASGVELTLEEHVSQCESPPQIIPIHKVAHFCSISNQIIYD